MERILALQRLSQRAPEELDGAQEESTDGESCSDWSLMFCGNCEPPETDLM